MSNNTHTNQSRTDTTDQSDEAQRRVSSRPANERNVAIDSDTYQEVICGTLPADEANVRITTADGGTPLTVTAIHDASATTIDLRCAMDPCSVGFTFDIESAQLLISALQAAVNEFDTDA
jgi:hypothetical protein